MCGEPASTNKSGVATPSMTEDTNEWIGFIEAATLGCAKAKFMPATATIDGNKSLVVRIHILKRVFEIEVCYNITFLEIQESIEY